MRAHRSRLLRGLTAGFVGLLISAGFAHGFSWDSAKEQQALQLARQFQALHRVPSIALSVVINGSAVLSINLDAGGSILPVGKEIRYRIASVTKQFTAAAILALIEDKTIVPATHSAITLDTTLGDIFPGDVGADVGTVSVRRLLTMTSNLPSYTDDPLELSADATGVVPASRAVDALQIIQRLKTYGLVGQPLEFEYSNTNYFVLGLIIHFLNGGGRVPDVIPDRDYLRRRILSKAGMTTSGFVGEPTPPDAIDAAPNFLYSQRFDQGSWPKGAGDLISTATDMARWNIALMGAKVIDENSVRISLTPVALVTNSELYQGCKYAMGWYVCDRPGYRLHQHDGMISGFMASNAIGRQQNGSWMSATVLGNIDATTDIVGLVRSIIEVGK